MHFGSYQQLLGPRLLQGYAPLIRQDWFELLIWFFIVVAGVAMIL